MRTLSIRFATLLVLIVSSAAYAQTFDTNPLEFVKGPEQWLLTADERRAWRSVKTREQAQDFIDLFWARRDPTPGTPPNEFRREFARRVNYADANFKEGRRRGALTERGRVLVVLGFPKGLGAEMQKRTSYMVAGDASSGSSAMGGGPDASGDPTGGRALAAKDTWVYERSDALKYGMPKIEVVFIYDGVGGAARRDPLRTDFTSALPNAIKHVITNPNLTVVPDWARPVREVTMVEATAVPFWTSDMAAKPAGAGRLTLVTDAFDIDSQTDVDPFAPLVAVDRFARTSEMGWAVEYCTGNPNADLEVINVTLRVSGMINGQRHNFNAPTDEMTPDSIKGSPGCYLVRGAVPLAEMEPGTYDLQITLSEPSGGRSYNLTRQFKVE